MGHFARIPLKVGPRIVSEWGSCRDHYESKPPKTNVAFVTFVTWVAFVDCSALAEHLVPSATTQYNSCFFPKQVQVAICFGLRRETKPTASWPGGPDVGRRFTLPRTLEPEQVAI